MLALVPGLAMGAVALGLPRDADAVNVAGGACEFDDFLRALVRSATGAVENIESTMVFDEKREWVMDAGGEGGCHRTVDLWLVRRRRGISGADLSGT